MEIPNPGIECKTPGRWMPSMRGYNQTVMKAGKANVKRQKASSRPYLQCLAIWGFPKIRGTFLGVPIIRTIVFWGLHWGSPYFGKPPSPVEPPETLNPVFHLERKRGSYQIARAVTVAARLYPPTTG